MKTVYLVRHAKAVKSAGMPDIDRPLDERGKAETAGMVERLRGRVKPDTVVSSPALRAVETAELLAAGLGYPPEKILKRKIVYDQPKDMIEAVFKSLAQRCGSVLVVGHNPSISECAARLAPEFRGDIPTCGIVGIAFEAETWKEAAGTPGVVILLDEPGGVPVSKRARLMRRELEAELAATIGERLRMRHPDAADDLGETVDRTAEKLAKKFVKTVRALNKKSPGEKPRLPSGGVSKESDESAAGGSMNNAGKGDSR